MLCSAALPFALFCVWCALNDYAFVFASFDDVDKDQLVKMFEEAMGGKIDKVSVGVCVRLQTAFSGVVAIKMVERIS